MGYSEMINDVPGRKRTRIVRPYPAHTLEEALAVARAIQDANAGLSFDRVTLARALGTTPASSGYTMRLNSSGRYGLTEGGYNDPTITLTPRGEAIVAPKGAEEQSEAMVGAALEPDLFRRFYEILDGKRIPAEPYAQNLLQREMGVHADLAAECLRIVKANGRYVGLTKDESGSLYVRLDRGRRNAAVPAASDPDEPTLDAGDTRKIFLAHGGNPAALAFLTRLLDGFGLRYDRSDPAEGATPSMSDDESQRMRSCSSAIIVLTDRAADAGPEGELGVPQSMAFQLGAASVLYGARIVILLQSGLGVSFDPGTVRSVEFDPVRIDDAAVPLLRALHEEGIVRITAG